MPSQHEPGTRNILSGASAGRSNMEKCMQYDSSHCVSVYDSSRILNDIKLEEIIFNQNALRMIKINGKKTWKRLNEPNSFWFKPIPVWYVLGVVCLLLSLLSLSLLSFISFGVCAHLLLFIMLSRLRFNQFCMLGAWSTISLAHTLTLLAQPQSKVQLNINNTHITHLLNWCCLCLIIIKCTYFFSSTPFCRTSTHFSPFFPPLFSSGNHRPSIYIYLKRSTPWRFCHFIFVASFNLPKIGIFIEFTSMLYYILTRVAIKGASSNIISARIICMRVCLFARIVQKKKLDVPKFTTQMCIEIGHKMLSRHFNGDKISNGQCP